MFKGLKGGWLVFADSIKVFWKHPKFIVPLLFTWLLYAPTALYFKFGFDSSQHDDFILLLITLGIISFYSLMISYSCSILLELIRQLESGETQNVLKATQITFSKNFFKILPISICWTIIWFLITIIQAMLSKFDKQTNQSSKFTAENAAKTLANYKEFSISSSFFRLIKKGVRMIIFLILPGEIWSSLGFKDSIKKGFAILTVHSQEFITAYVLSELSMNIVMIPALIIFGMSKLSELPEYIWYIFIVYIAFAWSLVLYLEQMICAELYIWDLHWEKVVKENEAAGKEIPKLIDIPKPSILDDINDLQNLEHRGRT